MHRRNNDCVMKNNIRSLRDEIGLSQAEFAEAVGCSRNTISSVERGDQEPTGYLCALICRVLGKTFDEVFYFEGEIKINKPNVAKVEAFEGEKGRVLTKEDEAYIFLNRVREFRKEAGLSQTELARIVGCSQNTISSIESGKSEPTAYIAGLICKALRRDWNEVFCIEKKPCNE